MTQLVLRDQFFAPVDRNILKGLLEEYGAQRARIDQIASLITGEMQGAMSHFFAGNLGRERYGAPTVEKALQRDGAIASLNSTFWSRALAMTDVFECFPQARRDEWNKSITDMTTPEFTVDSVIPTIEQLLLARGQYFAERIDGVFRQLSRKHVSNAPGQFNRRFIIGYCFSSFGNYAESSRAGYINDLRCCISKFLGRDDPQFTDTSRAMERAREARGQWMVMDGGSLRMRAYLCGTVHLEVHPLIADRLNSVLASLYPEFISTDQRSERETGKRRANKPYSVLTRPLPFAVLRHIREMRTTSTSKGPGVFELTPSYASKEDKFAWKEALAALVSIGGIVGEQGCVRFDYDPREVLGDLLVSGVLPDTKSHQFYQTPTSIVERMLELAQVGAQHDCLEPSAGLGAIADYLPRDRTACVELSGLRCKVLAAKGLSTIEADFLSWAADTQLRFDRILMNPPFTAGQARAHVEAAAGLLRHGGQLVAVMPASLRGKEIIRGLRNEWSETLADQFEHTNVSVALLTLSTGA